MFREHSCRSKQGKLGITCVGIELQVSYSIKQRLNTDDKVVNACPDELHYNLLSLFFSVVTVYFFRLSYDTSYLKRKKSNLLVESVKTL